MSNPTAAQSERRLAAIISADVVGYSRHMAEDETATVRTLQSHRETMRGRVREYHGRVVDAVGDNMMAEFQSAVDAVNCALDVQKVIATRNEAIDVALQMPFRIGIHIGDLLVDGEQIFGDGINIAARLEALAPAGGICISNAVYEQVHTRIETSFEDFGLHTLKNIPQPVQVWCVGGEQSASDKMPRMTVAGFGGRSAIAILPFENHSNDPEQEYLSDGIVEDVIAGLAAYRAYPVIARSSTFSYKGKHADARQVGAELGARYVVGGTVRKAGNRIRVGVELVDTQTGHQIKAERFDRESGDVFELQDDIVAALIASIEPALNTAEARRVQNKPTDSLDAWESLQKGYSLMLLGSKDDTDRAERALRHAIELDPAFAAAHAALSLLLWARVYFTADANAGPLLDEAEQCGRKAIELDPEDPRAHQAMGWIYWYRGNRERAIRSFERAIELNPSLSTAWWGLANMLSDEHPDEALALAEKAVRLSPKDPLVTFALHTCAVCAFQAGHLEDAVKWSRQATAQRGVAQSYRLLAAALGHLGRLDEAKVAIEKGIQRAPHFTITILRAGNSPKLVNRLLDGWAKAGWRPPD